MLLFVMPPPVAVSFGRDVAPIMAMRCNTCHGDAGGISTRSYREIMLGGNLGKIVTPGNPDASLLVHFLDGRRGEKHRMPKGGQPLSSMQIDTIRRWIAEGARDDGLTVRAYRVTVRNVPMRPEKVTRVFARVNTESYLVLTVRDPQRDSILWSEVATVKKSKDPGDTAEPGQLMSWDLRAGNGWAEAVNVELSIQYAASDPVGTEFYARLLE